MTLPEHPTDPKHIVPMVEMEPIPDLEDDGSSPEPSDAYLYPPGLDLEEGKHVFALSDVVNEGDQRFEPWPAELAGVDINIARESFCSTPHPRLYPPDTNSRWDVHRDFLWSCCSRIKTSLRLQTRRFSQCSITLRNYRVCQPTRQTNVSRWVCTDRSSFSFIQTHVIFSPVIVSSQPLPHPLLR